jgi:hypothetical protein
VPSQRQRQPESQDLCDRGIPGLEKRATWGTSGFFLCQRLEKLAVILAPEATGTRLNLKFDSTGAMIGVTY